MFHINCIRTQSTVSSQWKWKIPHSRPEYISWKKSEYNFHFHFTLITFMHEVYSFSHVLSRLNLIISHIEHWHYITYPFTIYWDNRPDQEQNAVHHLHFLLTAWSSLLGIIHWHACSSSSSFSASAWAWPLRQAVLFRGTKCYAHQIRMLVHQHQTEQYKHCNILLYYAYQQ